jgi:6-pyruvoyltetrahydropterin/6-carboxytetrahydropterin synthase
MIFDNGTREPLHGHNYRVQLKGEVGELKNDMVFDFLDIKPIVREVCDSLDHKLLIPKDHPQIRIYENEKNIEITTPDESYFSVPKQDVLLLPILNTSVERLAQYICQQILELTQQRFGFRFQNLEIEVEETIGQSAVYCYREK